MIKFMYVIFLTTKGKGYGCYAVEKRTDCYAVGASFCNPIDRGKFSKRLARTISGGRIGQTTVRFAELPDKPTMQAIVCVAMNNFSSSSYKSVPRWAMKCYNEHNYYCTLRRDSEL